MSKSWLIGVEGWAKPLAKTGFLLLLAVVPANLGAETASFQLMYQGKAIGTAGYRLTATQAGVYSESNVKAMAQGLQYSISKSEQLTAAHVLLHADLSAVVNDQAVHVTATANENGVQLKTSANGRTTTSNLAAHSASVLLPDFDAGALANLLLLAAIRNNQDLWVILPRGTGELRAVKLTAAANLQGTLDGKLLTVHHLTAEIAGATSELFMNDQNQLLQAELPQRGFALVRTGFALMQGAGIVEQGAAK